MKKVTVHRALVELKTINDRIKHGIQNFEPVGMFQKGKNVLIPGSVQNYEVEKHKAAVEEGYQSVTALMKNKTALKTAIVKSNAETLVTIGTESMTVADAITRKDHIAFEKLLLERMEAQQRNITAYLNKHNEAVEKGKEELLKVSFGKEGKVEPGQMEAVSKPYLELNTWHISDPLELGKKIADLRLKISTFEAEVDAVLSESNSTTFIEIN